MIQPMERIGEYLVRRLIGEGGMGKVYEAEERLSKRRVALKVLRPEVARSEQGRRMFLNEMNILAHLDHKNVVRCLACAEVDDNLIMALEYLEGQTLRDVLLSQQRLPWDQAVGTTLQIAAALAAAHRQEPPIIHRDLKPENVMILPEGTVKVMDFGIAKVLQAMSRTTTASVGTLQYMSPEQIDAATIDGRADLYCLGLVLYEMLVGRPPFESASPRELLNLQCTELAPPLPEDVRRGLPRGVETVLFQLLQKNPDERPPDAAAVVAALEPFGSADAVPALGAAPGPGRPRLVTEVAPAGGVTARVDSTPPVQSVTEPAPSPAKRSDTIALVERAAEEGRQISPLVGILIAVALSVVAGIVTYVIRSTMAAPTAVESATED